MPKFKRGLAAIQEANNAGSRKFKPFAPEVRWQDQETKFILILTPIDYTITTMVHEWIKVGEGQKANGDTYPKFESFISRKALGESSDDLEDRLGSIPRRRTLGAAVELEPVMETVDGRERPALFQVATERFSTRENGDKTAPKVGILNQAQKNFWGWLGSYDASRASVTDTPMEVVRKGNDKDTEYHFLPFNDVEIDLQPLFDFLENVSYLAEEAEELGRLDASVDNAIKIGNALLDKRAEELADGDRYKELVDPITEFKPKFGSSKRGNDTPASEPLRKIGTAPKSQEKADAFAKLREEFGPEG